MHARKTHLNWILLLIALSISSGCVRRRLTVRTNPPGAMVYVDRQLIGPSPASTFVTYYGTRHIEVVGDGYRTEKVLRTFNPPWYQIPPVDFVAETLWPWEIRDHRVVDITLVPEQQVASEELIARADTMRTQVAAGIAVPLSRTQGAADVPSPLAVPVLPPAALPQPTPSPVLPPATTSEPWRPGQILRGLLQPGERIPEVGGLQGGGYRPTLP